MDTSKDALIEIGRVLRKHVDRATLGKIIDDLQDVPGNKPFRDAIERLSHELVEEPPADHS
jgi:hypothetical protein